MKNLKTLALTLFAFTLISNAYAGPTKSVYNNVKELISDRVVYPFFYDLDQHNEILVEYSVDETGTISVKKMTTSNKELKKYVRENFEGHKITSKQYYGKTKRVVISFTPAY